MNEDSPAEVRPDEAAQTLPGSLPPTVVVDGANVVGARPDGWWRDRARAAGRLHAVLLQRVSNEDTRVVLVLEGAARAGVRAGKDGPVTTVHAPGHGDDALVDEVCAARRTGAAVLLVTADRALRARAGVAATGPSWVWGALEGSHGRQDVLDEALAATRPRSPGRRPDMA